MQIKSNKGVTTFHLTKFEQRTLAAAVEIIKVVKRFTPSATIESVLPVIEDGKLTLTEADEQE